MPPVTPLMLNVFIVPGQMTKPVCQADIDAAAAAARKLNADLARITTMHGGHIYISAAQAPVEPEPAPLQLPPVHKAVRLPACLITRMHLFGRHQEDTTRP